LTYIISVFFVKIGFVFSYLYPLDLHLVLKKIFSCLYSGWIIRGFRSYGFSCRFYPPGCFVKGKHLIKLGNNIHFGKNLTLTAQSMTNDDRPIITIGDNCVFGTDNHITASNNIIIGENLRTGPRVLICDNSHGDPSLNTQKSIHPDGRPLYSKGPIIIGDNVWLGEGCAILAGVKVGDGAIVGANCVVTHDIPDYGIAIGYPAKLLIKHIE
jgi:acetyltransferase-like isoleucine patch superfamily enzyme